MEEQVEILVKKINSDLGGTQCIQSAVIEPFFKVYFLSISSSLEFNGDSAMCSREFVYVYVRWLSETFFQN